MSLRNFHLLLPNEKLPVELVKQLMKQLLITLDFLHTECHLVHTDLKGDNKMIETTADDVFVDFEKAE
jgi:serine/threonine-protein kinase SRPK3